MKSRASSRFDSVSGSARDTCSIALAIVGVFQRVSFSSSACDSGMAGRSRRLEATAHAERQAHAVQTQALKLRRNAAIELLRFICHIGDIARQLGIRPEPVAKA